MSGWLGYKAPMGGRHLAEGPAEMMGEDWNRKREGSHHYCFKKLMDVANGEGKGFWKTVFPSGSSNWMNYWYC